MNSLSIRLRSSTRKAFVGLNIARRANTATTARIPTGGIARTYGALHHGGAKDTRNGPDAVAAPSEMVIVRTASVAFAG